MSSQLQHLLVDGSNVGRAWPTLARQWRKDANVARAMLIELVRPWHDAGDRRVSIVFDGRGSDLAIETPTDEASFVVVYSPRGMTADTVIEQWVARSREPASCLVVSADLALRETVQASGGVVISPEELAQRLVGVADSVARKLTRGRSKR